MSNPRKLSALTEDRLPARATALTRPVSSEELYRIDQVSELTGLTKRTLRYYEERGLLDAPTRTDGNYRLYSAADIDHIKRVKRIRETLGASLAQIKAMVEDEETRQAFRDEWARNPDPNSRLALLDRGEEVIDHQLELVRARLQDLLQLESVLVEKLRRYNIRREEIRQSGSLSASANPAAASE